MLVRLFFHLILQNRELNTCANKTSNSSLTCITRRMGSHKQVSICMHALSLTVAWQTQETVLTYTTILHQKPQAQAMFALQTSSPCPCAAGFFVRAVWVTFQMVASGQWKHQWWQSRFPRSRKRPSIFIHSHPECDVPPTFLPVALALPAEWAAPQGQPAH